MNPTLWVTPSDKSATVLRALVRGHGFAMRPIHEAPFDPGPSIVYGILRGCSEIIHRCAAAGSPYWHIDHGYFRRAKDFSGYYRITRNGLAIRGRQVGWSDGLRWKRLEVQLAPPQSGGDMNIAVPPTLPIRAHFRLDHWPVAPDEFVSEKGGTQLADLLPAARQVRAYNSNAALDAWIAGVAATQDYGPLDTDWSFGDREQVCSFLADQQWTLAEMEEGKCSMSWS